ncbi:hypothetical protein LTR70_010064 [Exophiala xenobiotica]|uniref:Uncharacterized protein n=1 Tax=Lithohypha guttulata TaxID=1690604 RepID=A0ABR0JVA2_9EURO|nr:hypothetical protein LTR24_009995 [Lithohypha guttulata]KAK5309696.1 hypothetical protein LTR70_010064 [Exophiala xenobiotica]
MPPRQSGSDGGSDQRRDRGRPVTPARNITQTVPAATTGRRTRGGNSAPLEDMVDDPDRILRGTRTPSRRLSVASNESRGSARAARPSVAASFNADLSAIGDEGDEENIVADADIPLPSTEGPRWTEQDTDIFGPEVPSPRGEARRSISSSHDSFESSIHSNRSSPLRNRGTTPDRGNAAGRRRSGERVDASSGEDFNDNDAMPGDRGPVRQASANPLIPPVGRSSRAPNEARTSPVEERGQAPNPDEPDDPGAEGDQPWDRIPWLWRLLSIFWEQFAEAMRYFKQARFHVSFGLAIKLLASVVCSAGPICDERSGYELILRYLRSATWECFCSLGVYTFMISGLIDSFEAIGRTLSDTGIRAAQQEEPLFNGWKGVLRHPMAFINEYLAPICRDVANKVLEPVLMLGLTLSLRYCSWLTFGKGTNTSDVVLVFIISFTLHLLKWICQTLEIFYDLPGNIPGLRWARRPLVSLLLLMLSIWAICYNWDVLSPSPTSTVRVVKAYWNSDQYPRTGNETTLSIASWITQSTKEAATQVYRVTQVLVTGGVVPTMSGVL